MTLTYKGGKINYEVTGKGPHLVFLHGFLENSSMWEGIIPHFETTYTCTRIDLLGHGKTDCMGYIHTMQDMAMAVKSVIDVIGIKKCILIGHSMGGYVSLAFTDAFASMVTGIVLLNSTTYADSEERKANRSRAIEIVKKNPNAYTSMAIANLFAEKNRDAFDTDIQHIKDMAAKTSLQGIIAALEGMKVRKSYTYLLNEFTGSKIIIAGKEDPVLSVNQNTAEATATNTPIITLEGGHMSYLENKDACVNALEQFFENTYTSTRC